MSTRSALIACLGAGLAYVALAHYFAERDLVAALLVTRDGAVLLAALALVSLRLFLILLMPGWLLWLVVRRVERELPVRKR